jgi:hypothetical protein
MRMTELVIRQPTDNILTLCFNGKIWKSVTLARTNVGSLKMVHMDWNT